MSHGSLNMPNWKSHEKGEGKSFLLPDMLENQRNGGVSKGHRIQPERAPNGAETVRATE